MSARRRTHKTNLTAGKPSPRSPDRHSAAAGAAQFGRAKASVAVRRSRFGSVQPTACVLVLIAHNPEEIVQWRRGAFHRLLTYPLPHCYSIAPMVSRAMRARALICLLRATTSAAKSPCLRALQLPLGAPPRAPCIRQTSRPRMAGAWHRSPLRFDLARHLNAWCISKCMGLIL